MQPRTCHLCCRTIAFTFAPRCVLARVCASVSEWLGFSVWSLGGFWVPLGRMDGVKCRGQGFRFHRVLVPVQCCAFCLHCGFLPQLRPRFCCLRGLIERLSCPSTHLRIYPPCSCNMWLLIPHHIYKDIYVYMENLTHKRGGGLWLFIQQSVWNDCSRECSVMHIYRLVLARISEPDTKSEHYLINIDMRYH